jgi:hypothetical protein
MQAIPGPDWYESLKIVSTQYQYQPGMKIIIIIIIIILIPEPPGFH